MFKIVSVSKCQNEILAVSQSASYHWTKTFQGQSRRPLHFSTCSFLYRIFKRNEVGMFKLKTELSFGMSDWFSTFPRLITGHRQLHYQLDHMKNVEPVLMTRYGFVPVFNVMRSAVFPTWLAISIRAKLNCWTQVRKRCQKNRCVVTERLASEDVCVYDCVLCI